MTEHVMRVPGDKSISHRALIFAALAHGESVLRNVLSGEDVGATARVLRQLGCAVPDRWDDGSEIRVRGAGPAAWRAPADPLDCGNSGTTARLMLGALSARPFRSTLTGDASLRSRPMRRVTGPLSAVGARFTELEDADRLPIAVEGGPLDDIVYDSPHASAQVKTALLLAALGAGVGARLTEPYLSRDHTERLFRAAGVDVETTTDDGVRAQHALAAGQRLDGFELTVPGDPSSAAFFIALGVIGPSPIRVEGISLNPTRAAFLAVLKRMGADLEIERTGETGGEPVGRVHARPSQLAGTTIEPAELPSLIDEVPILAVVASRAAGTTRFEGAAELRVKESDRLATIAGNFATLGVAVDEWQDGIAITGPGPAPRGRITVCNDHRIAMAFGVLGALPDADLDIDHPAVAAVSYPGFWDDLAKVRA